MCEKPEAACMPSHSVAEIYKQSGHPFETWTYFHPDGRSFTTERPVGLPVNFPYPFRSVTFEEMVTIWNHHRLLLTEDQSLRTTDIGKILHTPQTQSANVSASSLK